MDGIGWWLRKREELSGDREAVVDGDRRLTYRDLNRRVNRSARALQALGVKPGDRVGLLAYNRVEFVEVIFAAAKLGAILVPLNWRLTAPELDYILTDSGAETLLFDPALEALARELCASACVRRVVCLGAGSPLGAHAYEACLAAQPDAEPEVSPRPDGDTPHILMYTSGTTGRPKGAVLSQGASFWNALNLQLALDFTSADRNLLALPLFHIGGIGLFTLPMLYVGGTVVLQRAFEASETLRLLREERISLFFGVPAMFLFLLQHPEFDPSAFAGVRCAMSGGAPLPPSLVQQYHQAGIALQQGFGMSEAAPGITTLPKSLALAKAGSVGRALFHVEVRVVDERGDEVPRGQVGELVLRGPNLMQGYWNRPEATRQAFSGGWFHSGDLARMDEDGDLYIVDRKKDMFISGGENVYPAEVENLIYELPQVSEAAVVGVPDDTWGEVGCAVVAVKHGHTLTAQQVLEHLRPRLAKYKVPKRVVFVDALPRNAAGKVLKDALREQTR
ncbi:MAG: o-succinylbenzoate--CoA ligase [Deltaproteobacteria bacterium]|nr:o-succinylbenzoate--CoA ligase [Deltaproteobacteria bacterium]